MLYCRYDHANFHHNKNHGYEGEDGNVKNMFSVEKRASLTHFVRSLRSQLTRIHAKGRSVFRNEGR